MKSINLTLLIAGLILSCHAHAADNSSLEQRITELEQRVKQLEQSLQEKDADDRWREGVLWSRLRKDMNQSDVRKLLGAPARVEEAIFTTWYYHKTSTLQAYVWFDEGKVLGWKGLDKQKAPSKSRMGPKF